MTFKFGVKGCGSDVWCLAAVYSQCCDNTKQLSLDNGVWLLWVAWHSQPAVNEMNLPYNYLHYPTSDTTSSGTFHIPQRAPEESLVNGLFRNTNAVIRLHY